MLRANARKSTEFKRNGRFAQTSETRGAGEFKESSTATVDLWLSPRAARAGMQ